MIDSLDPTQRRFLSDLEQINTRYDRANRQVSSGLRIQKSSDAPDEISALLQARADLASVQQTKSNLDRVKSEVDTGEKALENAVDVVEKVRVFGAQGLNETQNTQTRKSLSDQVDGLFQQLVGLSNTAIDGRYLFSGNSDQTQPYAVNYTQPDSVAAYSGSAATRQIRGANGVPFPVAKDAQTIFQSSNAPDNVFAAVNSLRIALAADDSPGIAAALADVSSSLDHLNNQLAFYGGVQNQVSAATEDASNRQLNLKTRISETEEADLSSSILELQTAQTARQAALQVKGQQDRRTLFDFLR